MGRMGDLPPTLRGALLSFQDEVHVPAIVAFQFNPAAITRTLESARSEGGSRSEAISLLGPARQTMDLELEMDAKTSSAKDFGIGIDGILPVLTTLESMIEPCLVSARKRHKQLEAGELEISPPVRALTVLVWGPKRILPVRINQISIQEDSYDPFLVPIRATATVRLEVLSYDDLPIGSPGYYIYMAALAMRETYAALGSVASIAVYGSLLK